jgi:hypothetical protein
MYAGLVFVPLSQPYLHEFGEDWIANSPRRLVEKALNGGGAGVGLCVCVCVCVCMCVCLCVCVSWREHWVAQLVGGRKTSKAT